MENYIGTKQIKAVQMLRGNYNGLRGWNIPAGENPQDEGYLVEYLDSPNKVHPDFDNYISWSPKDVFERSYRKVTGLTFGLAIEALKIGAKVARIGWNGKGMYLYYVPENSYPTVTDIARAEFGDMVPYGAYIAMKTAQGNVVPWLASQTDVLAEDYIIL